MAVSNIADLCNEILVMIFHYLDQPSRLDFALACHRFLQIFQDPITWERLEFHLDKLRAPALQLLLSRATYLRELTVSWDYENSSLSKEDTNINKDLFRCLRNGMYNITTLIFKYSEEKCFRMCQEDAKDFLLTLSKLRNLVCLDLGDSYWLEDDEFSSSKFPCLKELSLDRYYGSSSECVLEILPRSCPALQTLSWLEDGTIFGGGLKPLTKLTDLQSLRIKKTDEVGLSILSGCKKLQQLTVEKYFPWDDEAPEELREYSNYVRDKISMDFLPSLCQLTLTDFDFFDAELANLANACPNLEKLKFDPRRAPRASWTPLAGKWTHLKHFHHSCYTLGKQKENIADVITFLKECPKLENLYLECKAILLNFEEDFETPVHWLYDTEMVCDLIVSCPKLRIINGKIIQHQLEALQHFRDSKQKMANYELDLPDCFLKFT